jgi:hypothetical protein
MLPPGATHADYQHWLASPAGQQAQAAENDRVRQRRESGGSPWLSNDGMVGMPQNWRQDLSGASGSQQSPWPQRPGQAQPQGNQFGSPDGGKRIDSGFAPFQRPGQAQPSQPQSQGTPYGGDMAAWGSQAAAQSAMGGPVQNIGQNTWVSASQPQVPAGYAADGRRLHQRPSTMPPAPPQVDPPRWVTPRPTNRPSTQTRQEAPSFTPGGGPGNMAYATPDKRPQPFQQRMTDWTGRQTDPSQGFAQRDAFVQNINQSRSQHAAGWGQGNYRAPPKNFGAMWGQAGDMAKGGWQNPLSGLFGGGK